MTSAPSVPRSVTTGRGASATTRHPWRVLRKVARVVRGLPLLDWQPPLAAHRERLELLVADEALVRQHERADVRSRIGYGQMPPMFVGFVEERRDDERVLSFDSGLGATARLRPRAEALPCRSEGLGGTTLPLYYDRWAAGGFEGANGHGPCPSSSVSMR